MRKITYAGIPNPTLVEGQVCVLGARGTFRVPLIWLLILLVSLTAATLIACSGQDNKKAASSPKATEGLGSELPKYEPLIKTYSYDGGSKIPTGWKLVTEARRPVVEAMLVNEENYQGSRVLVYKVEVRAKLEFDGGEPLTYEIGSEPITSEQYLNVFHRFGTWIVDFQYRDPQLKGEGIAEEATARSMQGQVLGRAKLKRLLRDKSTNTLAGVEIEETHLNTSGEVTFVCTSQYDFPAGFKRLERVTSGQKTTELFRTWAVLGE